MNKQNNSPFYKKVWFWLLALVAFIIFYRALDINLDLETESTSEIKESAEEPSEGLPYGLALITKLPKIPDSKLSDMEYLKNHLMTKEKVDRIKKGMTYQEVVEIAGTDGILDSLSDSGEYATYDFPTILFGSSVSVTFEKGVVERVWEDDLDDETTITLDEYEKLEFGMTYAEVTEFLEGEGKSYGKINLQDPDQTITYRYKGVHPYRRAEVTLFFKKGLLYTKEQNGLKE